MTPAIRALKAAGVAFTVHEYERDAANRHFGREAATALGLDAEQVFKTLLATADDRITVAVVPVSRQLRLKALGDAVGAKHVQLCDPAVAQRVTGYVLGGISPFGQRRRHRTVIDQSCELHDVIYVSGGRRGLDVGVAPADLIHALDATVASIAT